MSKLLTFLMFPIAWVAIVVTFLTTDPAPNTKIDTRAPSAPNTGRTPGTSGGGAGIGAGHADWDALNY